MKIDEKVHPTVADVAGIRPNLMSRTLTTMLIFNCVGMLCAVVMLSLGMNEIARGSIALFMFSAASSLLLFWTVKGYLSSVCIRYPAASRRKIDLLASVAKKFYLPFFLGMLSNMLLCLLGTILFIAYYIAR